MIKYDWNYKIFRKVFSTVLIFKMFVQTLCSKLQCGPKINVRSNTYWKARNVETDDYNFLIATVWVNSENWQALQNDWNYKAFRKVFLVVLISWIRQTISCKHIGMFPDVSSFCKTISVPILHTKLKHCCKCSNGKSGVTSTQPKLDKL